MRTIKFRAFHKKYGMKECSGVNWYYGERAVPVFRDENGMGIEGQWELMQFTGLKDKNGKEIYEGDVVKVVTKDFDHSDAIDRGDCRFVRGSWQVYSKEDNYYLYGQDEIEIIGNIYENKDLL